MEMISESISTPVTHKCDVVAGGGVTGITAALAEAMSRSAQH